MLVLRPEQPARHEKASAAARLAPRRPRKHHASRLERFVHERDDGENASDPTPTNTRAEDPEHHNNNNTANASSEWPSPVTNEVAALLLSITAGGTLTLLSLLYAAWTRNHPSTGALLLGCLPMAGALALATSNLMLRRWAKAERAADATSLERQYRRLEWLEWTTILVNAGLVLAALNTALPAISEVMRVPGVIH